MKASFVILLIVGLLSHGSEIVKWNEILLEEIAKNSVAPPRASRLMAMVHVAQFEAVNAISRSFEPYLFSEHLSYEKGAVSSIAAAQAAHDILFAVFPADAPVFMDALDESISGFQEDTVQKSKRLGSKAAASVLSVRGGDVSNSDLVYEITSEVEVGDWRPTAPAFASALLPDWGNVKTWVLEFGSQFRPSAPPAVGSAAYIANVEEVRSLGDVNSVTRTAEQAEIALVWAAGSGTVTPPGQWFQIASQLVETKNVKFEEQARLFALLGISVADAGIAAWDCKYAYNFWRPITAIQEGSDGVDGDPTWTPLLTTPPFSAYVSGHSTFSGAGATVLSDYFGSDSHSFSVTSDGLTRSFSSLWTAAAEAGQSRIYGGIHYQFDNTEG
jgi:hypothetical protein